MPKKILIFSTAYLPLVGGAEIAVKELTDRLAGFDFDLITARLEKKLAKQEKIGRIMVYRVGLGCKFDKFLLPWLGVRLALKLHKTKKYDLIWAIMASFGGLTALFFKKKNPKIPYLLTLQEGDTPEHIYSRAKWLGPYYKQMFTGADFITAISQYLKNFALKQGATAPIEVVPNGVDIEKFSTLSSQFSIKDFKNKLSIRENDKIIITISRLVEKNGVGDIIEAMRFLPTNVKLLIIGTGELERKLKDKIISLKLNDRVLLLGAINNDVIPEYLAIADIFVRPSLSEGQGIAFLEAMAAGVPVIATPVGGIVDFLHDGQTGLFSKVRNPKSIAEKIKIYLGNKKLIEKIKINAKEIVIKNYNWDLIAKKMEAIFNVSNRPANGRIKVLIATGIYPPDFRGPATMLEALPSSLEKKNFLVKVVTYSNIKSGAEEKEKVYRIRRQQPAIVRYLKYFFTMFKLALWADVIYSTDIYSVGYFSYLIKKLTGKKYIIRFAGDSAWETAVRLGVTADYLTDFQKKTYCRKIEKLKDRRSKIMVNADKIIAVSRFLAGIASLMGVREDRIKLIYNSVDFINGNCDENKIKEIRGRFGVGAKIIISTGQLNPWKGFDGIIRSLPEIEKSLDNNVHLLILGDGQEMENLKKIANELGVGSKAHFLGKIEHREIMNYFSAADLFILNSHYEGLSHTLLEVMKAGVPIIASNIEANQEVIENNKNGILVDYNNAGEISRAVIKILNNKALAENFVSQAKEKLKIFNWDNTIKLTVEAIKEIL